MPPDPILAALAALAALALAYVLLTLWARRARRRGREAREARLEAYRRVPVDAYDELLAGRAANPLTRGAAKEDMADV